ncbi:Fructose-1,6-bisphosphatase class 3 [Slackia heliotrinireducens]|uniref:Uncharacterized conserved protein n=1 Tax=Slackia heliotrinireducens (strain ATCC 29202 / DSM 20476 / NCTC 11029 / RHS 1) TaxID=471855 RepID=C7N766_SLAHD|nr:fructose-bisphosphatase class III [Slackia heliotrinireducens]ACV22751.1 uncharacterized conserved protein [Slackia heliotrinireducens DSM 20476]VEH01408.1 Fructose-1,6-bisphosphatase class 3 [Slackia heliotrinireducens]
MTTIDMQTLEHLSETYPTAQAARAEAEASARQLADLKGAVVFASDVHGEYNAFDHILRSGCGSIRQTIDSLFADELTEEERAELATLVYYPREKAELLLSQPEDQTTWLGKVLPQLAAVLQAVAEGRPEALRREMPEGAADTIGALLAGDAEPALRAGDPAGIVEAVGTLIQRLSISHLHMVGDVYDRGPSPELIMDMMMGYHSIDIQWGNHDVLWMGAALGQRGCVANVVRICARYGNFPILEDSYGISMKPLVDFALETYKDDPCVGFAPKIKGDFTPEELARWSKIQKAIAYIQFKVEAKLIAENPSFGLDDRNLLHLIDRERGTVVVDGVEYEVQDMVFPTVDWDDPYRLSDEESAVMDYLEQAFMNCEKLQRHIRFFLDAGSFYKICGDFLLYHACVPLNADGSLKEVTVLGETYKGRSLFDAMERYTRQAFDDPDPAKRKVGRDMIWYMWLGQGSPLFAKSKMATFEIYMIADKAARKEVKNPYYSLLEDEQVLAGIFEDFGMDPAVSRIVSGHVPVKVKDGEDPVKCGGKAMIIDGGFSRAYQSATGIAGFALVNDANGLRLGYLEPLESQQAAIERNLDIVPKWRTLAENESPLHVGDTEYGLVLRDKIDALTRLAEAYEAGDMPERA